MRSKQALYVSTRTASKFNSAFYALVVAISKQNDKFAAFTK